MLKIELPGKKDEKGKEEINGCGGKKGHAWHDRGRQEEIETWSSEVICDGQQEEEDTTQSLIFVVNVAKLSWMNKLGSATLSSKGKSKKMSPVSTCFAKIIFFIIFVVTAHQNSK